MRMIGPKVLSACGMCSVSVSITYFFVALGYVVSVTCAASMLNLDLASYHYLEEGVIWIYISPMGYL